MTLNKKLFSTIVVLWAGLAVIGVVGAWQNRASMVQDRHEQLTSLVQQGIGVVDHFYVLYQQHILPEDEAKRQALAMLSAMRYGKNGYISVNDSRPVMLMHPFNHEVVGRNMAQFTDPSGRHLFVDCVIAGNQPGGGFVDYLWTKPGAENGRLSPKTTYVMRFQSWDWYLGTGMYMDDLQTAFYHNVIRWIAITVVLGTIATAIMVLVLRSVATRLEAILKSPSKQPDALRSAILPRLS
jgi:methyl-accepting chemotaxis protein